MKRMIWLTLAVLALWIPAPVPAAEGPLLGEWNPVTPTGTYTPRRLAASAVANSRLWIIGGVDADGTTVGTVEGLWFLGNTWQAKLDMPTPRNNAAAVTVNEKVYVIGGYDASGTVVGTVEMFDPVANTWTPKTPMNTPRAGLVAVAYDDGTGVKIHVYGGDAQSGHPADKVYEIYDVAADTWTSSSYLAPSAQADACGVAAEDLKSGIKYLHLFGGYSGGGGPSPSAWRIETSGSTGWEDIHSMPEGRILAGAVTITAAKEGGGTGEYPLVIGGNINRTGSFTGSAMVYQSGDLNGWVMGPTIAPDLPEPRGDRPAVCVYSGYVYVASGATDTGPASTVVRAQINSGNFPPRPPVENPLIFGWVDVGADIPTPRSHAVSAVVDGKIYVIGGADANWSSPDLVIYDKNEMYDPESNTWTTKAPMPVPLATAAACAIGAKIYVAGGQSPANDIEGILQIYDTVTDTWTSSATDPSIPPLPTPRKHPTGCAVDGKFHVICGYTGNDGTGMGNGAHEIYDPVTNTWSSGPSYLWGMADASVTHVPLSGYDWIVGAGGWNWMTQHGFAARWNAMPGGIYNDQWYQIANLPVSGNSGLTMAAITDLDGVNWPVAFGGHYGPVGFYNKVFAYHDFDDVIFPNTWVEDTRLPFPRGGRMGVHQIGNYVYIVAGEGPWPGSPTATTWRGVVGSGLPFSTEKIGEALAQPNGKKVSITTPKVVTRTYISVMTGECYFWIEEEDRSAAVRVGPSTQYPEPGNKVTVSGTITNDTITGERTIAPSELMIDTGIYPVPKPIGISNKSFIGGPTGSQPGRPDGNGLNNMGMLGRVWGKVTTELQYGGYEGNAYFYIDDGSGLMDGTDTAGVPNVGLRVYNSVYAPLVNNYVLATGIISCEKVNGTLVPILLTNIYDSTDIQVLGTGQ